MLGRGARSTPPREYVDRLSREIRNTRQQVADALADTMKSPAARTASGRVYQAFASFQGDFDQLVETNADDCSNIDRIEDAHHKQPMPKRPTRS